MPLNSPRRLLALVETLLEPSTNITISNTTNGTGADDSLTEDKETFANNTVAEEPSLPLNESRPFLNNITNQVWNLYHGSDASSPTRESANQSVTTEAPKTVVPMHAANVNVHAQRLGGVALLITTLATYIVLVLLSKRRRKRLADERSAAFRLTEPGMPGLHVHVVLTKSSSTASNGDIERGETGHEPPVDCSTLPEPVSIWNRMATDSTLSADGQPQNHVDDGTNYSRPDHCLREATNTSIALESNGSSCPETGATPTVGDTECIPPSGRNRIQMWQQQEQQSHPRIKKEERAERHEKSLVEGGREIFDHTHSPMNVWFT